MGENTFVALECLPKTQKNPKDSATTTQANAAPPPEMTHKDQAVIPANTSASDQKQDASDHNTDVTLFIIYVCVKQM